MSEIQLKKSHFLVVPSTKSHLAAGLHPDWGRRKGIGQMERRDPHPRSTFHELTTNSAIGVSRLPVLDCRMTFHPGFGGRDSPSILSDDLWKHIFLATEAPSDSFDL